MRIRSNSPLFRAVAVSIFLLSAAGPAMAQSDLQTPAEASGFTEYTTYADMMTYLQAVQASTLEMRLAIYGESYQGRELPVAIFSRPGIREPWEALVSQKPIAVLTGNVHGGERTLRESLLILIRDLATPGTAANRLLDDLIILVVPSANPDGLEAQPRPSRGNAWGIDLNRDYMKLEQDALAAYSAEIINTWHPHILVDGHNGGSYPYNVTYQSNSNDTPDPRITQLCDEEIFPFMNAMMEENGYRSFYYSGTGRSPGVWNGGGSDPRIARNYLGFANCIGILFESPGGQEMELGVLSGVVGYMSILEYTARNPGKVMSTVSNARWGTVAKGEKPGDALTVQQEYGPADFQVTYQYSENRRDPESPLITIVSDSLMIKPVPTLQRTWPYAYLLPRDAVEAVAMLQRHGITIEVLQDTLTLEVEAYVPAEFTWRREYNHEAAVFVEVEEVVTLTQRFPAGTYMIPTGQFMGRVAAHLLEPETNDNVVRWNTMDAWLPLSEPSGSGGRGGRAGAEPRPRVIPIYKVMQPVPIPTRILR
ncbi:M14 family zinc carboxypeptidase [Candidatus Zixiibacteriota bacterium]